MKKIYLSLALSFIASVSFAQGWQYVGSPFINQSTGFSTYLYFPDLEFNAAGDIFAGYWQSQANTLFFVKYDGTSWAKLPSPGTAAANYVDIEVKGNNYYMAYSGVKGSNMYVWVKKYNGTTWTQLGDSLLLGNSGSGGWFDFILDNSEVPTLLGTVNAVLLADKQMVQFTAGAWAAVYTFPGSAGTIFREGAGIYDAQNKLNAVTQGTVTTPSVKSFTVAHQVDGGIRSAIGDTIYGPSSAHRIKLAGGSTYLIFNEAQKSEVLAYKLNGNSWDFVADTVGAGIGIMLSADVAGSGSIVFNTLTTNLDRSLYIYDNENRLAMDSINLTGTIASVGELVIPAGSNEVYAMVLELNGFSQDISVVKHTVTGSVGIDKATSFSNLVVIYPNPTTGTFTLRFEALEGKGTLKIYNVSGQTVYNQSITSNDVTIKLNTAGIYFVEWVNEQGISSRGKLVVE